MKSAYIGGQWVLANGESEKSFNPANNEVIYEFNLSDKKNTETAIFSSQQAFDNWRKTSYEERVGFIKSFKTELEKVKDEFAEAISKEMGKPLWESKTEVTAMMGKVDISIEAHENRLKEVSGELAGAETHIRYKPHGPVVVIGPFNLPGHLPNGHIIPALLAGNTVIFKPSEKTPMVGKMYTKLWESVGIPNGVLNMVQGKKEVGEVLVSSEQTKGIFFTGSYGVGSNIHRACAGKTGKILALEMGGNNPLIVHEVNDTRAAAYTTIQSAYITSGQRCVCARRLILIEGEESAQFLSDLQDMIKKILMGPYTSNPESFMGPVVDEGVFNSLIQSQEDIIKKGAKPLIKMKAESECENLLSPGLLDVTNQKNIVDEEFFGPLLQVIYVKDFESAIKEAGNTKYGLAAGLLSDSSKNYQDFYQNVDAGIINWNRQITGASAKAPFGGTGNSGNHRPSAFFAADYCAHPIASIESNNLVMPEKFPPGIEI